MSFAKIFLNASLFTKQGRKKTMWAAPVLIISRGDDYSCQLIHFHANEWFLSSLKIVSFV